MKAGQYIVDRLLPEFIRAAADRCSASFTSMSDGWVLRLERADEVRWVLGYQFDVNTAAASALAQDKVATYLLLKAEGIAAVPHVLVRSVPNEQPNTDALRTLPAGPIVLKPLDGTSGRGVRKVNNITEAAEVITESVEVAWAASPYYEIQVEYRVIVLDGKPLLAYEKTMPTTHGDLKFFNLGMGAIAADVANAGIRTELEKLAVAVCARASLRLAAVDIVRTKSGELLVLEINDGMMMENYARQSSEYEKRAAKVYDAVVRAMFS